MRSPGSRVRRAVVVVAVVLVVGAAYLSIRGAPAEPTGSEFSPGLPAPSMTPYDQILSVDAMPVAEVIVFVGSTGPDPPALALCDAMGVGRDFVSALTGAIPEELVPAGATNGQAARCAWRTPASGKELDASSDGFVDVVSVLIGIVSEADRPLMSMVFPSGVYTTPGETTLRKAHLDPEYLDGVDPAVELDLFELEFGTRLSVSVSDQVDDNEAVAGNIFDHVLETLDASG